jgi:6-phosphogluconate dehydrogenase
VGTSGGIWGFNNGFCLMIGGANKAFKRLEPAFQTLAPSPNTGYGHVGQSGTGHFVKMIHNGIEYGLMEAYAEGFELLQAKNEFKLNMPQIARIWCYGSVIRSWLLDLVADALEENPEDSGEGRWAVNESLNLEVPAPAITAALQMRFRSRQSETFGAKLLATLRHKFGGHALRR